MSDALDIVNSTLASSLRLWRGTLATPAVRRPRKLLELYEFEACPFCRLVREALTELDLDALIYPSPRGGTRFRPKVKKLGGQQQFPYLVDPNTGRALYESDAIIRYLYTEYGKRPVPTRLLRPFDVASATLASVPRLAAGTTARSSKPAAKPLELFSFESSPYSRRVRELMCELELPYVLRNTGKARWQDLGPPSLRARLFPDLPVEGRNRKALLERAGRVQLPYLVDPNTGVEMFESAEIRKYLLATYSSSSPSSETHPPVGSVPARHRRTSRRATKRKRPAS
jgi:glutathione S-transferase